MKFARVKPLDAILATAEKKSLHRSLGAFQLTLFGIGCIIGTGIFVLTSVGAQKAGPGVLISFTPFYGFHFLGGLLIAWAIRGNLIASMIGTFVNNFLTLVPISAAAVGLGYWILGMRPDEGLVRELGHLFQDAGRDLWHNVWAVFTAERMDWAGLSIFFREAFIPYFVGGVITGLPAAIVSYWLTVPLVRAYQAARRKALEEKLSQLRKPPGAGPLGR